jgi:hypothetical protein
MKDRTSETAKNARMIKHRRDFAGMLQVFAQKQAL